MKLPERGFLVDPVTGKIKWAWDHVTPNQEFDLLPPIVSDIAGNMKSLANPGDIVLDMTTMIAPGEMPALYHKYLRETRVRRRPNGSWRLVLVVRGVDQSHPSDPNA